jgi:hypothetical protein
MFFSRREIRKRDRIRKTVKKYSKQSDIDKYKKQRNRVNNLKKIAKEHFEQNLDNISLLRIVTILVGMHSLATLRNVSVKVLHISSTS